MIDNFKLDQFSEKFNEVFDEGWYNKMSTVLNYVLNIPEVSKNYKNVDSLAKKILDYNVQIGLKTQILSEYENNLPKIFDWKETPITQCFLEFKKLIDYFEMSDKTEYVVTIVAPNNFENEVETWLKIVYENYIFADAFFLKLSNSLYELHIVRNKRT